MNPEFMAIIGVGVSNALLIYFLCGGLREQLTALRERMAKLEGSMDGFTKGFSIEN